MHKDRSATNDPPAPFCYFRTIPFNFGAERWEVFWNNLPTNATSLRHFLHDAPTIRTVPSLSESPPSGIISTLEAKNIHGAAPGIYRCISMMEGGHLLAPFMDTSTSDVAQMSFPPNNLLELSRYFQGILKQRFDIPARIGMIELQSNQTVGGSVGKKVACAQGEFLIGALLVISGKYTVGATGNLQYLNPREWMIKRLKESQSISPKPTLPDSLVAIFYFVLPHAVDALGKLMGKSTLDEVKDGFTKSGLKLTHCDGDKSSLSRWTPAYGEKYREHLSLVDSFIDSINTHLKRCKKACMDESTVDGIKPRTLRNNLKYVATYILRAIGLNIAVIANTPKGLSCTHGDQSALSRRSNDCSNCTLYLHHMFHPTIPSYERQTEQRYVLIVPCNDDVSPNVEPFSGIVYPPEYAPYGKQRNNAKKRSPRVKKAPHFVFQGKISVKMP